MDYQQALKIIDSYTNYEKTPVPHAAANYDLRRVEELLSYFDSPHLKTRSVHITGTKGKGSTAAMIASVLSTAGYRTGLYTSPHLLTIRERIKIGNELISEQELVELVTRLYPVVEDVNRRATYGKITTFEFLTAMAFIYFRDKGVDLQVLEVGMGGTYDATNVIKIPAVCVITSISYDHTQVLGNTLTAIASEKCGIIKPGCTVVSSPQFAEAMTVIRSICGERRSRLIEVGDQIQWRASHHELSHQRLLVNGRLNTYDVIIPLIGDHQLVNTATAIGALEVLIEQGYHISQEAIVKGLAGVNWPGRFQVVSRNPYLVLDGAHNPDSGQKLKSALTKYFHNTKIVFVVGISSDKDISGIVKELAPVAGSVIATRSEHSRAADPNIIASEFKKYGIFTETMPDISSALNMALNLAGNDGVICVTGSLFLVAEALKINIEKTNYS